MTRAEIPKSAHADGRRKSGCFAVQNSGSECRQSQAGGSSAQHQLVSQQFSSFWAGFARIDLKITDPQKVLYSFRHSFKDAIGPAGASDDEKKHLMGHAETGSTKGYGTKRQPKPVDIDRLNQIVQGVKWPFLEGLG